jgi:hypothetical protein
MNSFVITLGLSTFIVNSSQFVFGSDFRGIVSYWDYPTLSIFGVYISFDRFMVFILAMLVLGLLLAVIPFIPPFNQEYLVRWMVVGLFMAAQAVAFDFTGGYINKIKNRRLWIYETKIKSRKKP